MKEGIENIKEFFENIRPRFYEVCLFEFGQLKIKSIVINHYQFIYKLNRWIVVDDNNIYTLSTKEFRARFVKEK